MGPQCLLFIPYAHFDSPPKLVECRQLLKRLLRPHESAIQSVSIGPYDDSGYLRTVFLQTIDRSSALEIIKYCWASRPLSEDTRSLNSAFPALTDRPIVFFRSSSLPDPVFHLEILAVPIQRTGDEVVSLPNLHMSLVDLFGKTAEVLHSAISIEKATGTVRLSIVYASKESARKATNTLYGTEVLGYTLTVRYWDPARHRWLNRETLISVPTRIRSAGPPTSAAGPQTPPPNRTDTEVPDDKILWDPSGPLFFKARGLNISGKKPRPPPTNSSEAKAAAAPEATSNILIDLDADGDAVIETAEPPASTGANGPSSASDMQIDGPELASCPDSATPAQDQAAQLEESAMQPESAGVQPTAPLEPPAAQPAAQPAQMSTSPPTAPLLEPLGPALKSNDPVIFPSVNLMAPILYDFIYSQQRPRTREMHNVQWIAEQDDDAPKELGYVSSKVFKGSRHFVVLEKESHAPTQLCTWKTFCWARHTKEAMKSTLEISNGNTELSENMERLKTDNLNDSPIRIKSLPKTNQVILHTRELSVFDMALNQSASTPLFRLSGIATPIACFDAIRLLSDIICAAADYTGQLGFWKWRAQQMPAEDDKKSGIVPCCNQLKATLRYQPCQIQHVCLHRTQSWLAVITTEGQFGLWFYTKRSDISWATLHLADRPNKPIASMFEAHQGYNILSCSFSPESGPLPSKGNMLLTSSEDGVVRLWELVIDPRMIKLVLSDTKFEHRGPVRKVEWCPTSNAIFASASDDGTVAVWDISKNGWETSKSQRWLPTMIHSLHNAPVVDISWCPDVRFEGMIASLSSNPEEHDDSAAPSSVHVWRTKLFEPRSANTV
ncbi:WD40-repeat-containing domain protein [Polychytrium aggregatum]|uniref:WD40-repeat-containing domain protein n=1 Tax=Polychytrium aggregatum TaxID=110093 RepID=UPI0022FED1BF|nr:WD40-repeat-containing domain protein [Polychytrium aggregatum]KAI9197143.1 WD40-repeat-containing domain protein [Polychytrium aggregatum]